MWSSLLSLPVQMLISSRNTLANIPRKNILRVTWASLGPVKLTHKINHHTKLIYEFSVIPIKIPAGFVCLYVHVWKLSNWCENSHWNTNRYSISERGLIPWAQIPTPASCINLDMLLITLSLCFLVLVLVWFLWKSTSQNHAGKMRQCMFWKRKTQYLTCSRCSTNDR